MRKTFKCIYQKYEILGLWDNEGNKFMANGKRQKENEK